MVILLDPVNTYSINVERVGGDLKTPTHVAVTFINIPFYTPVLI